MAEHTPGPWWVDGPGEGIEVHDTFGRTASVWGEGAEAWANARLIAAATELLAALKAGLHQLEGDTGKHCLCKLFRTAIAKAEGRSE
jgi:hypothetical protein